MMNLESSPAFIPGAKLLESFRQQYEPIDDVLDEIPAFHEPLSLERQISEEVEGVLATFARLAAANAIHERQGELGQKEVTITRRDRFNPRFGELMVSVLNLDPSKSDLILILNDLRVGLMDLAQHGCHRFWGDLDVNNEGQLRMHINLRGALRLPNRD